MGRQVGADPGHGEIAMTMTMITAAVGLANSRPVLNQTPLAAIRDMGE